MLVPGEGNRATHVVLGVDNLPPIHLSYDDNDKSDNNNNDNLTGNNNNNNKATNQPSQYSTQMDEIFWEFMVRFQSDDNNKTTAMTTRVAAMITTTKTLASKVFIFDG